MFEAVPPITDAALMANILHDWSDDDACGILSRCREAMAPSARLLVVEIILTSAPGPHWISDFLML